VDRLESLTDFGKYLKQEATVFAASGIVDLSQVEELFRSSISAYQNWIEKGFAGEMHYLVRGLERRIHPELLLPNVKSVFAAIFPYSTQPIVSEGSQGFQFARYLRGEDYHETIKSSLDAFAHKIVQKYPSLQYKVAVDTSAVLERTWAALCGLGWIGKNGLLIHPKLGSYFFIGTIMFNFETGASPELVKNYCGSCVRCISACPTSAFVEPKVLDARKCLSYQTLEFRGSELPALPEEIKKVAAKWVAGCDICQEVCPFNQKRVKAEFGKEEELFCLPLKEDLLMELSEFEYKKRVQKSSLSRIKFTNFRRNLSRNRI
jgi:epoxyqueuosine reductase